MADLFRSIRDQTKMRAFFARDVLNLNEEIEVDFDHTPLKSVLNYVLGGRKVWWKYYKEIFVIVKKDEGRPGLYVGERLITCKRTRITIRNFLDNIIVPQTKLDLVFNSDQLNVDEVINVDFDHTPLDVVLASFLGDRGLTWKYSESGSLIVQKVPPGKRIIRCNFNNIRFRDLWEAVWQQARVQAFYSDSNLDSYEKVTASVGIVTLDDLLKILLANRNLTWHYREDAVLIVPKNTNKGPLTAKPKSNMGQFSKPTPAMDIKAIRRFWIQPPTLPEVIAFEKQIRSHIDDPLDNAPPVSITSKGYPLIEKYRISPNPFVAERHSAGELPTYVRYYYTKDSVVRMVVYDWMRIYISEFSDEEKDKLGAESRRISAEEHGKLSYYEGEFDRIKKILINQFGKPTTQVTEKGVVWDKEKYYGSLNLLFSPEDHRVTFKFYWK